MTADVAQHVSFIGAGRLARALAPALGEVGVPVSHIASRTVSSAECLANQIPNCRPASLQLAVDQAEIIFVTVPDDAIQTTVQSLTWPASRAVIHCSGALGLEALQDAKEAGALIGSFHPLQTFAGSSNRASFQGVTIAIDGDPELLGFLETTALSLGAYPKRVPAELRARYHAAACIASNYLITLSALVENVGTTLGWTRSECVDAFLPLMRGALDNLERQGLPDSLTGPISRGDILTISAHLEALGTVSPDIRSLYAQLGLATLPLVLERGIIDPLRVDLMSQMLLRSIDKERTASCA